MRGQLADKGQGKTTTLDQYGKNCIGWSGHVVADADAKDSLFRCQSEFAPIAVVSCV
jgi:hypothetical protein